MFNHGPQIFLFLFEGYLEHKLISRTHYYYKYLFFIALLPRLISKHTSHKVINDKAILYFTTINLNNPEIYRTN